MDSAGEQPQQPAKSQDANQAHQPSQPGQSGTRARIPKPPAEVLYRDLGIAPPAPAHIPGAAGHAHNPATPPSGAPDAAAPQVPTSDMTVVTCWYVNTPSVHQVLLGGVRADRGFGRKLLSLLNPRWPIAPIGQFNLFRSAPASRGEFYIGAYPDVAVVQTTLVGVTKPTEVPEWLRNLLPAENLYIFCHTEAYGGDIVLGHERSSLYGCAYYHRGSLIRTFAATPFRIVEDLGVPEPAESALWSGQIPPRRTYRPVHRPTDNPEWTSNERPRLALPFDPESFNEAMHEYWLGFIGDAYAPPANVVAYAVDGRTEPKLTTPDPVTTAEDVIARAVTKLGFGPAAYDDYEDHEDPTVEETSTAQRITSFFEDFTRNLRPKARGIDLTRFTKDNSANSDSANVEPVNADSGNTGSGNTGSGNTSSEYADPAKSNRAKKANEAASAPIGENPEAKPSNEGLSAKPHNEESKGNPANGSSPADR